MAQHPVFDAIVVGSGITGGLAAKELTEAGLKVLMIERGPMIEHGSGYTRETLAPWDLEFRGVGDAELYDKDYAVQRKNRHFTEFTQDHFVNDRENPYTTEGETAFNWWRSYQLGGRSLTWGRHAIAGRITTSTPIAAMAMVPIGRSATPISRPGMTRSRSSSGSRAWRRACPSFPTGAFSRPWR
jgi:choline dehydrogenase-like flavoprotein